MGAMITSLVKWPSPGRYIIAVSGGADSMVLLDLLATAAPAKGYDLVVAHFDHGIRPDSGADFSFVEAAATRRHLKFIGRHAGLGKVSEASARTSRYRWLEALSRDEGAQAIITAHHEDDLLETSLLNLARGSGRRGLAPMRRGPVLRPLLGLSRTQLRDYAKTHRIAWNEDETNADITNPRNYLRRQLLPSSSRSWRQLYLGYIAKMTQLNTIIDQSISEIIELCRSDDGSYEFPLSLVRDLSLAELEELLAAVSRFLDPHVELDRRVLSEIALFAKTGRAGTKRPIRQDLFTGVQTDSVRVYYMGIQGRR